MNAKCPVSALFPSRTLRKSVPGSSIGRRTSCAAPSEPEKWAQAQFAAASFGDERLRKRAVDLLSTLAAKPSDSIPQACENWGQTKGAYRFLANEKVTVEKIVCGAAEETARQCAAYETVLAVQDTTILTFPRARATEGLHPVGALDVPAMLVHSTVALRENGVPIGMLGQLMWCRDPDRTEPKAKRKRRPIEEKESVKWIRGIEAARGARGAKGRTPRLIHVGDRECDVHEVFQEIAAESDGAVIRCSQNRRVKDVEGRLRTVRETVRGAPVLARRTLEVPRKKGEPSREACVEVRACRVTLAPHSPYRGGRVPVELHAVEVWEPEAPDDATPLNWLLWTTESAATAAQALRVVDIYCKRWKIEEFHLTLKSGCRIEDLRLRTAERIAKAVALYSPLALRIVHLRDLARTEPDAPCTEVLSEDEWRALWVYIHHEAPSSAIPPPTVRQAVLWIGRIGGHLGRKSDGMPGVRTLWRGWRDLANMVQVYRALQS